MPLAAQSKLGPYEIVAPLGAGGMGEVYRARDSRLGREVAIKVLPEHTSRHPEVRARFEREAKTVSSLNHPHICVLYDIGREGDTDYLVMELVEGETLAQRLTRGALPIPEVLRLGGQIADALDRAHRAGIVHRDLKPGNVMLTRSGVKLMDFGLARVAGLIGGSGSGLSLTHSPTVASPLTAEGTLIGTFQYMAPEQLEGKEADARSDLWALGCVLYEMAIGRRAFEGKSQASLISAIMSSEPPPITQTGSRAAAEAPPALDHLVRALLAKDPEERIQTAHDARLQLQWIAQGGSSATVAPPAARRGRTTRLVVLLAGLIAAAGIVLIAAQATRPRAVGPPLVLTSLLPPDLIMSILGGDLALSADGRMFALIATDSAGVSSLWVLPLDGSPARPLAGTEGAYMPFWSPDGRAIAFFAGGKLRRVSIGGTPTDVCAAASGRGGAWGADNTILFAPSGDGPLQRVSAEGGTPESATDLDSTKHEVGHRFPRFLADGRRFFYATTPVIGTEHEIYLGELGSRKRRFVLRCDGVPDLSPEGWLLYHRSGLVYAQRFDVGACRLTGRPEPVMTASNGSAIMAAPFTWTAPGGVLASIPQLPRSSRLMWVDRTGRTEPLAGVQPGGWFEPRLSHAGGRVVVPRASLEGTNSSGVDVWLVDLDRGIQRRLTSDPGIENKALWSPDDRSVLFASNRTGKYALFRVPLEGGGEPELVARGPSFVMRSTDWSPDGRYVLFEAEDPRSSEDVWIVDLAQERATRPLLHSEFSETEASFSPDGRTIAFVSDESGRSEVYVQPFPEGAGKIQVSTSGGQHPRWRADGRELFYRGLDRSVMAVPVLPGPGPRLGQPVRLFTSRLTQGPFAPARDGQRFLMVQISDDATRWAPSVFVNWTARLKH